MNFTRRLNFDYAFVQGTRNMVLAAAITLASLVLVDKGFSSTVMGVIFALSSITAIISQTWLSDYADRHPGVSTFKLSAISALAHIAVTTVVILLNKPDLLLAVIYVIMLTCYWCVQPFINNLVFRINQTGYIVNFGVCRSVGSITYAILCSLGGSFNEKFGSAYVLYLAMASMLLFIVSILLCEKDYQQAKENPPVGFVPAKEGPAVEAVSYGEFLKHNRFFVIAIFGMILINFGFSIFSHFTPQIVATVGGNSADAGSVVGFSAWWELPTFVFFSRLSKKFKASSLMIFSSVFYALKLLCFTMAKSMTLFYVGQALHIFGFPLMYAAILQFIDEIMPKNEALRGHALYSVQTNFSAIASSLLGGIFMDTFGASASMLVSFIICVVGIIIFAPAIIKTEKLAAK